MSSPEKKKKRKTTTMTPNPSLLPDDLLVSIFARISRLYYPTLSLVSKSFRSLLASPELYETRSLLGNTESCLYVCLQFPTPRWFTLSRKPDHTLPNTTSEKKSSGYVLASIPAPHSPVSFWSGLVSLGSNIYNIGGYPASSSVSILDCQSHKWHDGPSLQGKRMSPSASVFDGKIYVAGGCKDEDSDDFDSIEVFYPSSQVWDLVPKDCYKRNWDCIPRSSFIEGKLHLLLGRKGLTYDPKENKWGSLQRELCERRIWISQCVIEDVLYCYHDRAIQWYSTKDRLWRKVKGLKGLPKFACRARVRLADYGGGKMVVLWDKFLPSSGYKNKVIWCAVIALERCSSGGEVWGKLEWCDAVLLVPMSYVFVHALAVIV
ncbi:hypothetical protein EUTSA_v10029230mg [Eutrema salsugineum]|uniref:F-box domain-containing protein n=1 Tax=Eutrema salsugineum TaxID=72664 RepID=V4MZY8_EUTSA|nr:F-box/kelch-repeat protein At4g39550 [Eutrema salsugineum]ESQ38266.1 hypothetical protein EUTSA_v10029230mg [Eutrema salsugineum]